MHLRIHHLFLLSVLAAAPAGAATLFGQAGYRFGSTADNGSGSSIEIEDAPSWGAVLQFPYEADTALEIHLGTGRSPTGLTGAPELEISHLQLGGIKYIETGWAQPFVGASVGMSRFSFDTGSDRFRPAYALYGGVEWTLARHLKLRAEARWMAVYFGQEARLQCGSDCTLSFQPGTWTELEAHLGLGVGF